LLETEYQDLAVDEPKMAFPVYITVKRSTLDLGEEGRLPETSVEEAAGKLLDYRIRTIKANEVSCDQLPISDGHANYIGICRLPLLELFLYL
jgi:hypothetical protein